MVFVFDVEDLVLVVVSNVEDGVVEEVVWDERVVDENVLVVGDGCVVGDVELDGSVVDVDVVGTVTVDEDELGDIAVESGDVETCVGVDNCVSDIERGADETEELGLTDNDADVIVDDSETCVLVEVEGMEDELSIIIELETPPDEIVATVGPAPDDNEPQHVVVPVAVLATVQVKKDIVTWAVNAV